MMSLRIFGGIGSIRLESRKNSLRLAITTKVKESITNQLRITLTYQRLQLPLSFHITFHIYKSTEDVKLADLCKRRVVKNMPNAARIGHELTEIRDDSPRFARFSLTIDIKKAHTCFRASVPK